MKKSPPPSNPDAYVAELTGWRRDCVLPLRKAVLGAPKLEEVIKWGHLVYFSDRPVLLIRAEEEGFVWVLAGKAPARDRAEAQAGR